MGLTVKVKRGSYRNKPVVNKTFRLVRDYKEGAKGGFITVNGTKEFGQDKVRILVSRGQYEIVGTGAAEAVEIDQPVELEPEEIVMDRLDQKFNVLDQMTLACLSGDVTAMIVSGPPGVGKSFGVETKLEEMGLYDTPASREPKYAIVKGAMTPIGLYQKLYEFADKGKILVFDDCDGILQDDLSLDILKAALDSGKRRKIYWAAESSALRREKIPNCFEFKGSVIFISNINFDSFKSKKLAGHIDALKSRCHYLDLAIHSMRDRFLRIKRLAQRGDLFEDFYLTPEQEESIMKFLQEHADDVREMSIRTALKLAQLVKVDAQNWRNLAAETVLMPKQ